MLVARTRFELVASEGLSFCGLPIAYLAIQGSPSLTVPDLFHLMGDQSTCGSRTNLDTFDLCKGSPETDRSVFGRKSSIVFLHRYNVRSENKIVVFCHKHGNNAFRAKIFSTISWQSP